MQRFKKKERASPEAEGITVRYRRTLTLTFCSGRPRVHGQSLRESNNQLPFYAFFVIFEHDFQEINHPKQSENIVNRLHSRDIATFEKAYSFKLRREGGIPSWGTKVNVSISL